MKKSLTKRLSRIGNQLCFAMHSSGQEHPPMRFLIKGVLSATGDTDVTGDREKSPKARQKE